jgi:GAF domain-containing protein
VLDHCAQQIAAAATPSAAIDAALQALRQLTPITTCALYRYEPSFDHVVCLCSAGDPHNLLPGLIIRLGERVTGWCAANLKAAVNSDAYLDLVQTSTRFSPPLRSSICVPFVQEDRIAGVLTGYSTQENPFDERHRYVVERVADFLNARLTFAASHTGNNVRAFPATRQ